MTDSNQPEQPDNDIGALKRKTTRGAVTTFASQGIKFIISFGSQLVLAHLLTPAQFGLVAMAAPVMGFVAIFTDLGLSQATIQRSHINQRELTSLFWINLVCSLVLALVLIVLSPLAGRMYGQPEVGPVVEALASLLVFGGLASQSMALMRRNMQFDALAGIDVIASVIGAVAGIGSALAGASYWALVIAQAANSVVTLMCVWSMSGWRPSRPQFDPSVKSMLQFGGHLTAFNIVSFFSSYFDNFLVGLLSGPVALGLFDRAFKLVLQPLGQITTPIGRVAVPMLSRLTDNDTAYRNAYLRMLQLVVLFTMPGLVCASVMSSQIVLALLGSEWAGTAPILRWLSIAAMFAAYSGSTYWLFVSQNRAREQMTCGFISSGAILISLLAGLPWGPVGIAAAYALFAPLVHGIFIWVATRTGPVARRDVLTASYPIACGSVVAALALLAGTPLLHFPAVVNIAIGCVGSYALCGLVLLALPAGNRMLRGMWALKAMLKRA